MSKVIAMISQYKSGQWIRNRIENLLNSEYKDLEIWCANANSPDEQDDQVPQQYKQVKYIKLPETITVYQTWNTIIERSDSEYIFNANTDDTISPQYLTKMIQILQHQKCHLAYSSWYTTATYNAQWPPNNTELTRPGHYTGDLSTGGVGHFPIWRRKLHQQLGMFNTQLKALGDAEWWARCYYIGQARFRWVDEPLACYLWRNGENLWQRTISQEEWQIYHEKVNQYKSGTIK